MMPLKILGITAEAIAGAYLIDYFRYKEENINYQIATFLITLVMWYFTVM